MLSIDKLKTELDKAIKEPRVEEISVEVYTYAGEASYVFRFESFRADKEHFFLNSVGDVKKMEVVDNDLEDEIFEVADIIEFASGADVFDVELWLSALYGSGLFSRVE